jgi:hypothetical protein
MRSVVGFGRMIKDFDVIEFNGLAWGVRLGAFKLQTIMSFMKSS